LFYLNFVATYISPENNRLQLAGENATFNSRVVTHRTVHATGTITASRLVQHHAALIPPAAIPESLSVRLYQEHQ